ncbi:MAG: HEAT repeat domain-containing protein, partial [Cyanobacteria bacterium J06642_11]
MDTTDTFDGLDTEIGGDALIDPLDAIPLEDDAPRYNPDQMLPLLQSDNLQQRMLAARAFYKIQEPRAIPRLIELLNDDSPLVRVNAAYALGRNPSETAVDALINQLTHDSHGYVRKAVVWALGNCKNEKAVAPLVEAVENDMSVVRLWAASALGQMGKISFQAILKAIPALVEAMR